MDKHAENDDDPADGDAVHGDIVHGEYHPEEPVQACLTRNHQKCSHRGWCHGVSIRCPEVQGHGAALHRKCSHKEDECDFIEHRELHPLGDHRDIERIVLTVIDTNGKQDENRPERGKYEIFKCCLYGKPTVNTIRNHPADAREGFPGIQRS